MASILGDGTGPGGPGPSRCLLLLQRSLAIQLIRGAPPHAGNAGQRESPKEHPADEMWMYDKGYNLFQVSHLCLRRLLSTPLVSFCRVVRQIFVDNTRLWSLRKQYRAPFSSWIFARWRRKSSTEARTLERRCDRAPAGSSCPLLCSVLPLNRGARVLYGKANVDYPHRYATMRQCELRAISQKSA